MEQAVCPTVAEMTPQTLLCSLCIYVHYIYFMQRKKENIRSKLKHPSEAMMTTTVIVNSVAPTIFLHIGGYFIFVVLYFIKIY